MASDHSSGKKPWSCKLPNTVSPVPTSTRIWLQRVECGTAESNMLHMRLILTFLFLCFSWLKCAPGEAYLTELSRFLPPWVKWELRSGPGLQWRPVAGTAGWSSAGSGWSSADFGTAGWSGAGFGTAGCFERLRHSRLLKEATAQEAAEVQAPAQQGGLDEYDVLPSYDLTNFSSMISTHILSLRKYFQCFTCN